MRGRTRRMVLYAAFFLVFLFLAGAASPDDIQKNPSPPDMEPGRPAQYEVILEKENPNGVVVTEKKIETVWAAEDFWIKYKDWDIIEQNQKQIILRKPYEE
ncbi:BofC N-terminal domain-containing protein [Salibacterium aidingense]|uniref:BofC N-terminal domain-containing protein n=1 Tax=Salibacterium aidingense TaxID=384933 RepID=UPI00041E2FE8|nr:BofC N-terminal domain-containing protein [Salibacterium aidingense]